MIDHLIRAATCATKCGDEHGTGFLIDQGKVMVARHAVLKALTDSEAIELTFQVKDVDVVLNALIVAESEALDVCLLVFAPTTEMKPLAIDRKMPRDGTEWRSFGFPRGKIAIGHRVFGRVSHTLPTPKLKMDMDLSVDPSVTLQDYSGLSGAPLVIDDSVVGMIRLKVDGTIGAISMHSLEEFLEEEGIETAEPREETPSGGKRYAERAAFQKTLETHIQAQPGEYLFVQGAHGIGKTTFCNQFKPVSPNLLSLGAYSIFLPDSPLSATYRAQPSVIFDWFLIEISALLQGKASRKEDLNYPAMVVATGKLLEAFADFAQSIGRQALVILDGLNEAQSSTPALLPDLLGLLPIKLPPSLTVILTAPNFADVAPHLAGRVKSSNVIALPPLTDAACSAYCRRELETGRATPDLVRRICEKALGHPLYLRYIIEYANGQPTDDVLADFPVLVGPIEDYYQTVWLKLLPDGNAVSLIAILARLRSGIPITELPKLLTGSEQTGYLSTIERIRHLFAKPESTQIYHQSFAAFATARTQPLGEQIHDRIAGYCSLNQPQAYCANNLIFHLARGSTVSRLSAPSACNQEWFDRVTLLGCEPDALIADIEDALGIAVEHGPATEAIRLLLLTQRVNFRYNTLVAQSAQLMAEALIALNRPAEALKHVLRFETLIVAPGEAMHIALCLIRHGHECEARELLRQLYRRVAEAQRDKMRLTDFIGICEIQVRAICFFRLAGARSAMKQFTRMVDHVRQAASQACAAEPDAVEDCVRPVQCIGPSYLLAFRDTYASLADLSKVVKKVPPEYLPLLCAVLMDFESTVDRYGIAKHRARLPALFADIHSLVVGGGQLPKNVVEILADTLIRFGAPTATVELFGARGALRPPGKLALLAANGVDVAMDKVHKAMFEWRTAAFLDLTLPCPEVEPFSSYDWVESFERLIEAVFWCDGRSRRALADKNAIASTECLRCFKDQVLASLGFTLANRAHWENAYAIPEAAVPFIYRKVVELVVDCFPNELPALLAEITERTAEQLGVYSEGYRRTLNMVLNELLREEPTVEIGKLALGILLKWRDHVLDGVENRHEIVPEILRLIPLFTQLGANEEGERLYRRMMAVSMGPSWYKEEQLGLLNDVLIKLPVADPVESRLPIIAGLLEKCSGEITFQRYVRADKGGLAAELFRRGLSRAGSWYFRRQTCGTIGELFFEATKGTLDRISPMKGMRFPGGALEEQATILRIVEKVPPGAWQIRWALLEIYHFGDERHIADYGAVFATLANVAAADPSQHADLLRRADFVLNAETPVSRRDKFAHAFRLKLTSTAETLLAALLPPAPPPKEPLKPVVPPETTNEETDEKEDDRFFAPGVFGRKSAQREADRILQDAEAQLALGNKAAAKALAVKALECLQKGEWDIWHSLSGARRAEEILLLEETDAASLIRRYAPLIKGERHTPSWIHAQNLMEKVVHLMKPDDRLRLLDLSIDHVKVMVGESPQDTATFAALGDETTSSDIDKDLFNLVIWLCDHPKYLRAERAAGLVLWLVESLPRFRKQVLSEAMTSSDGIKADILCGALDGMSLRSPLELWTDISAHPASEQVITTCRNVSRLMVWRRIATRAAEAGSPSGRTVVARIDKLFSRAGGSAQKATAPYLPHWANSIQSVWMKLSEINLASPAILTALKAELTALCTPLSISDAAELESLVTDCFRDNSSRSLNRWDARVRAALNLALFPIVDLTQAIQVEQLLRIYNPSQPERIAVPKSMPLVDALAAAIPSGKFADALADRDYYVLHLNAMRAEEPRDPLQHIEVTAVLVPSSNRQRGFFPPTLTCFFRSTQLPTDAATGTPQETCSTLALKIARFGSFTPAVPLPKFAAWVKAEPADFISESWRGPRDDEFERSGQPVQEGCLLKMSRRVVLPPGKKLAWLIKFQGQLITLVDEENNQLA